MTDHNPSAEEAYQYFVNNNISNQSEEAGLFIEDESELANLAYMPNLKKLHISGVSLSDKGIKLLANLPLQVLSVRGVNLSEEGMKYLCHIKTLKVLHIENPYISDGFEELAHLTNLQELYLYYQSRPLTSNGVIDDKLMDGLNKCHNLVQLELKGSRISDIGASKLMEFTSLEHIRVENTDITENMQLQLKKMCENNIERKNSGDDSLGNSYTPTSMAGVYEEQDKLPDEKGYFSFIAGLPAQKSR